MWSVCHLLPCTSALNSPTLFLAALVLIFCSLITQCGCDYYANFTPQVYWPDDDTWWTATVLQLDTAERHMQLLYTNLQQEDITGPDFESLIKAGHLAEGWSTASELVASGDEPLLTVCTGRTQGCLCLS